MNKTDMLSGLSDRVGCALSCLSVPVSIAYISYFLPSSFIFPEKGGAQNKIHIFAIHFFQFMIRHIPSSYYIWTHIIWFNNCTNVHSSAQRDYALFCHSPIAGNWGCFWDFFYLSKYTSNKPFTALNSMAWWLEMHPLGACRAWILILTPPV